MLIPLFFLLPLALCAAARCVPIQTIKLHTYISTFLPFASLAPVPLFPATDEFFLWPLRCWHYCCDQLVTMLVRLPPQSHLLERLCCESETPSNRK